MAQPVVGRLAAAKYFQTAGSPQAPAAPVDIDQEALQKYIETLQTQANPFASQELKTSLEKYQPDDINFTPFAALADKWSGKGNGSQLTTAAKTMLDDSTIKREVAREGERNQRQEKAQSFQAARDYNNDLVKAVKPFEEVLRSAAPVRSALQGKDGRVNVQKVSAVVTLASKLLGVVGAQTEGDISRTQFSTLERIVGELQAKVLSDPNATMGADQVRNLLETVEDVIASNRKSVQNKVKLTRDAYVVGRGLPAQQADAVQNLYQDLITDHADISPVAAPEASKEQSAPAPKPAVDTELQKRIEALRNKNKN